MNKPRVRIAPSPTGNLHIGTARAALFNWLYARSQGGVFVLRIEDTDLIRSEKRFEQNILDGLKWLGLAWDEGPVRQSERLDVYEKYINQLLKNDLAYFCDCSEEELDSERKAAMTKGVAPKYGGKCRDKNLKTGQVIRFKVPAEKISFEDIIRGKIEFDGSLMGDIAIAKNPRVPLYNFAVVVDDYEMDISHVVRGEDHIANTPKQIFIQRALGFPSPLYGHLPLVLDQNRAKLSKRFSATSVDEFRLMGFLPEALLNFLTLLGWHPEDNQEIMTMPEIIKRFSLERIQKSGAVFDMEKLRWINAHYLRAFSAKELKTRLEEFDSSLIKKFADLSDNQVVKIIGASKDRMQTLKDFSENSGFFFEVGEYDPKILVWKKSNAENAFKNLNKVATVVEKISSDYPDEKEFESVLAPLAEKFGKGDILWPLRAALSGLEASPGPFEIAAALGKAEVLKRINHAIDKLQNNIA